MPFSFGHQSKLYWLVFQNYTLRVHRVVFTRSIFFEKNTFPFVFHFFRRKFFGFLVKFSTTAVRIDLVSRCFNPISAIVFKEFMQIFIDQSVRTALDVTTGLFSWESSSLEKNTFQIVIQIFGGNFSGFRQNFSTTAVKNALVCTFFSSMFCQFFAELKQIFIDRSVRFALDVTTGMFSWESSSLKKKDF